MEPDEAIFSYGQYEVWVNDESYDQSKYDVVNISTDVVEHTTEVLHQAIRVAKIYDTALNEAMKWIPNNMNWAGVNAAAATDVH